jgi:hypothetical protein
MRRIEVCMRAAAWVCAIAVVASGALVIARPLPVIVDFNTLVANDANEHIVGAIYEEDGMRFTAIHLEAGCCPVFAYPGSQMPLWIGSPTLWHLWSNGTIVLERVDGQRFDLLSIDIGEIPSLDSNLTPIDFGPIALTFVGIKDSGTTVTATFSAAQFPAITRVEFPRTFKNLVSVSWRQGGGGAPGAATHQFDNVVAEFR